MLTKMRAHGDYQAMTLEHSRATSQSAKDHASLCLEYFCKVSIFLKVHFAYITLRLCSIALPVELNTVPHEEGKVPYKCAGHCALFQSELGHGVS